MQARILSHHGRQAWVIDGQGQHYLCVYKGRDQEPMTNDWVEIDQTSSPAVILRQLPRKNTLLRSEAHRSKALAANIDQALIVISGDPLFSDELLARMICACVAEGIPGLVVVNKMDLVQPTERARQQLASFAGCLKQLDWTVIEVAAKPKTPGFIQNEHADLVRALTGKTTLVLGQSGMGKSSLLNWLVPEFNAQTQEISTALQTGRHTTTASRMVYAHGGWLIDTPGFQLFGLHHLSETQLALGFPEWASAQEAWGRCRFANCHHLNEPGCSVRQAVDAGEIAARRLSLWQGLLKAS
jgi:ribosome biogenesis GTPase